MGTLVDVGVGGRVGIAVDVRIGVNVGSALTPGDGLGVCVTVDVGVAVKVASALVIDSSRVVEVILVGSGMLSEVAPIVSNVTAPGV